VIEGLEAHPYETDPDLSWPVPMGSDLAPDDVDLGLGGASSGGFEATVTVG